MATLSNILIVDVISELIATLRETSSITNLADNGDGTFTIETDDLKNLSEYDYVTFDAGTTAYQITGLNETNKTFNVTASGLSATTWISKNPFYFHGTAQRINTEFTRDVLIQNIQNGQFVFLMEVQSDKLPNNPLSSIMQESEIRIFFMRYTNANENTSQDFWDNDISEMQPLADAFIDAIDTDGRFGDVRDITRINYATWGDFVKEIGIPTWKIDAQLSGTGLAFTLPIKRNAINCTL